MASSGEDMRDAVQALLRDMRGGADGEQLSHGGAASASPARGGSASPRHVGPANLNGSQLADVDAMRAEIYRLETELHNAQQALDTERGNHARTRELLRLALKPSGADVAVDGAPRSPSRRHASASPGRRGHQSPSSSHLAPSEVPGFVRHASAAQQTLAPRAYATSSSVVNDIFDKVTHTSARRQRSPNRATTPGPAARSPAGFRSPSATSSHRAGGGASVSGRSRGTAASNGGSAFGSRTERFRAVTLSGHHGMYISRNAQSYSDELSRTEAKKLASEMQRAGMITPTRTGRGQPHSSSPQPSPIFTGVVKASPSSSTLRSPDIAKWVRQLQH